MLCWLGSLSELAGVGIVESESLLLQYRLWLAMLAEAAFWVYGDSMRADAGIGEPDMISEGETVLSHGCSGEDLEFSTTPGSMFGVLGSCAVHQYYDSVTKAGFHR